MDRNFLFGATAEKQKTIIKLIIHNARNVKDGNMANVVIQVINYVKDAILLIFIKRMFPFHK